MEAVSSSGEENAETGISLGDTKRSQTTQLGDRLSLRSKKKKGVKVVLWFLARTIGWRVIPAVSKEVLGKSWPCPGED